MAFRAAKPSGSLEAVQAAMTSFWSPAVGDDGSVGGVADALKAAALSKGELVLLKIWLGGGSGSVGIRRAQLRELCDLYMEGAR
jgi:hypothetical protein